MGVAKMQHQLKVPDDDTVKHRPRQCNRRGILATTILVIVMMFLYQRTLIYTELPTSQSETTFEEWIQFYWEYAEQHANDAPRIKKHFKPNEPLMTEIIDRAREDEITTLTTCPMVIRKEAEQVHTTFTLSHWPSGQRHLRR